MKQLLLVCLAVVACADESNVGTTATRLPGTQGAAGHNGGGQWAITIATWADDSGASIAVNSNGDVVAVGATTTAMQIGSAQPENAPIAGFITQRAADDGSERWSVILDANDSASPLVGFTAVAIAANDDVIACGDYYGTVDFGGQTLAASGDSFVASYSASGALNWVDSVAATVPGVTGGLASQLAIDPAGNIVIAGGGENASGFVASYDLSGALESSFASQAFSTAAVMPSGELVTAGTLFGSGGSERVVLSELSSDGQVLGSQLLGPGSPGFSMLPKLVVDSAGHPIVQTLESDGGATSAVVRELDDTGAIAWTASTELSSTLQTGGIMPTLAAASEITTGRWTGTESSDDGAVSVTTYTGAGSATTAQLGSGDGVGITATVPARNGAFAFTGSLQGTADFGTGPIQGGSSWFDGDEPDADALIVVAKP